MLPLIQALVAPARNLCTLEFHFCRVASMLASTPSTTARLSYVNVFAHDHRTLMRFYAELLGFPELLQWRSPIFGCLDAGGVILGFHAEQAYELLGVAERKLTAPGVNVYATFELADVAAVDLGVERAKALGAKIIKAQYRTYYDSYQAVLADPEGNVFRLNHELGRSQR
jgi:predicted enzyme related to lactoylglutathione lyase